MTYAELATRAASATTRAVEVQLKDRAEFEVVGTPTSRVDALAAVTGRKQFATDLDVPGALPTMVCRPPTLNGTPEEVRNREDVLAMPGVTDVVTVDSGVAVRAQHVRPVHRRGAVRSTSTGPTGRSPASPTTTSWPG